MAVGLGIYLVIVIVIPAVGAVAGWLAGQMMKGHAFGAWTNASLGILGSIVGCFLFGFMGLHFFGLIGVVIKAALGGVIAVAIADRFKKRQAG